MLITSDSNHKKSQALIEVHLGGSVQVHSYFFLCCRKKGTHARTHTVDVFKGKPKEQPRPRSLSGSIWAAVERLMDLKLG